MEGKQLKGQKNSTCPKLMLDGLFFELQYLNVKRPQEK